MSESMNVFAVKDTLANVVTELGLYNSEEVLKRALKNTYGKPSQHPYHMNPEDYRIYNLGSIDIKTGILSACDPQPLFFMSDLINETLVQ